MRIIGLYGHGQCGKSATLNEVKELLRRGIHTDTSKIKTASQLLAVCGRGRKGRRCGDREECPQRKTRF